MTEIAASPGVVAGASGASGAPASGEGLRARQARQVYDDLLAGGLELMAELGYDRVTTEAISRYAGVSPRTFFRYFASKDALLTAPFIALAERLVTAVVDQPPELDAWSTLCAATLTAATELEADPTTFRRAAGISSRSSSPLMPSASRLSDLEAIITTAMEHRLPVDADPLAAALLSGLQALVLRTAIEAWIAASDPRPLTKLVTTGLDALSGGARRLSPVANPVINPAAGPTSDPAGTD